MVRGTSRGTTLEAFLSLFLSLPMNGYSHDVYGYTHFGDRNTYKGLRPFPRKQLRGEALSPMRHT
jgi:hypothetical protein